MARGFSFPGYLKVKFAKAYLFEYKKEMEY